MKLKVITSCLVLGFVILSACNDPNRNYIRTCDYTLSSPFSNPKKVESPWPYDIYFLNTSSSDWEISNKTFLKYPKKIGFYVRIGDSGGGTFDISNVFSCISDRNIALPFEKYEIWEQNLQVLQLTRSPWVEISEHSPTVFYIEFSMTDLAEMQKTSYFDFRFTSPYTNQTIDICRINKITF